MSVPEVGVFLVAVSLLLVLGAALGVVTVEFGSFAVVLAIGVLAVGIVATDIRILPVLAFPATLVMVRAGPLSISDLVLVLAAVPALLVYGRDDATPLQPLLWAGITFQAMLVPTVLLHPYGANVLEWFHVLVLVLGGLVVGWVVGRHGYARTALTLFILGCLGIAVAAVLTGVAMLAREGTFGPVYMPSLHKNFIGNTLAFAFLMLWVRPDWLGWNRQLATVAMLACAGGIAASGSRQAMVSVVVVVALLALQSRTRGGGRGRVLLLALLPAAYFVANSVSDQLQDEDPFNSAAQRLVWFTEAIDIWATSPAFGVGLRWWYTGNYSSFQPPNAFFEMLSSAGVVGLIGFLVLCGTGLWVVLSLPPRYGQLAGAVVLARFVQGQLDLYWVAGQAALPWMVTGLVIGLMVLEREQGPDGLPVAGAGGRAVALPRAAAGDGSPGRGGTA